MKKITAAAKLQAVLEYAQRVYETTENGVQAFKVLSVSRVSADCYQINTEYLKSGRWEDYHRFAQCFRFRLDDDGQIVAEANYEYTNDNRNMLFAREESKS